MNRTLTVIFAIALVVLGIGYFGLSGQVGNLASQIVAIPSGVSQFGAGGGTTFTNVEQFLNQVFVSRESNLNAGAPGVTTSTIPASATTTASPYFTWKTVCENNVIDVTLPITAKTLTLPSSSYLFKTCLGNIGDSRKFWLQNASTSGYLTVGMSDSSSSLKQIVNGTSSVNGGDLAAISAVRVASGTQTWLMWTVNVMR